VDRRGITGGRVATCAGPWRSSGGWWHEPDDTGAHVTARAWDRDEWDVTFPDGTTCLLVQDRAARTWCIDGVLD